MGADIDVAGAWDDAVALAERFALPVWGAPLEARLGFPQDHPSYQGDLAPGIALLGAQLEGHDFVLVVGATVFRYYPYVPGAFLPEGTELVMVTSDSLEAARAPVGDAVLGNVALALKALLERSSAPGSRPAPPVRPGPAEPGDSEPLSSAAVFATLREVFPADGAIVLESPSNTPVLRDQIRISRPNSYFFCAGGGLGFGMGATVGVQLAMPDRPVIGVIGDGSAQYAITALWTAAAYEVPATFLVPAQRRVRDPQVVRRVRAGVGRARAGRAGHRQRGAGTRVRSRGAPGREPRGVARSARRGRFPPADRG